MELAASYDGELFGFAAMLFPHLFSSPQVGGEDPPLFPLLSVASRKLELASKGM